MVYSEIAIRVFLDFLVGEPSTRGRNNMKDTFSKEKTYPQVYGCSGILGKNMRVSNPCGMDRSTLLGARNQVSRFSISYIGLL